MWRLYKEKEQQIDYKPAHHHQKEKKRNKEEEQDKEGRSERNITAECTRIQSN